MSLKHLSISRKLIRMNLIVSASVLVFSCGAFTLYELVTFKNNAVAHLSTDAEMVGIGVTSALLFLDADAAAGSLRALRVIPNVVAAAVYGPDGRMFAKYARPAGSPAASLPSMVPISANAHRIDVDALVVWRQIVSDDSAIGMVYIQSDLKDIEGRLQSYAAIAVCVLAASFIVALVVSSILERKISAPILSLAETTRTIASKRDYSLRAAIDSRDETGVLGEAFNDMLRQIQEQNDILQESERNFRELANAMPQIVWVSSAQGERQYINQRWFDYTGTTVDDIRNAADLLHPEDRHYFQEWKRSVETGAPFNIEYRIRRAADGTYRWHLARALPVHDARGQVIRWFGTSTDIDDQKRAEEEVRQINAELEQRVAERTEKLTAANAELANANEAKDRFLATMSHELRTPLNAIIGFTGTLLMKLAGPLTVDQDNQLKIVRSSAKHLLSLINDLLDLAKIESGKVVLNPEPVSCNSVVEEVGISLAPLAEAKGLRFDVVMPDSELVVPTDRRALSQILINLTSNAIKFTDKGYVRLELARLDGRVEISVTDSGIGIKEEDRKNLFQAFEQVYRGARRPHEGTGLGLHLSQKLASLLGTEIICRSEFGSGTRFFILL